jgi:hypothetical protein
MHFVMQSGVLVYANLPAAQKSTLERLLRQFGRQNPFRRRAAKPLGFFLSARFSQRLLRDLIDVVVHAYGLP